MKTSVKLIKYAMKQEVMIPHRLRVCGVTRTFTLTISKYLFNASLYYILCKCVYERTAFFIDVVVDVLVYVVENAYVRTCSCKCLCTYM